MIGDVKVTVLPLIEAISFSSFKGRFTRLNQVSESGNGSSPGSLGLWSMNTTRSEAKISADVGEPFLFGNAINEALV